MTAVDHLRPSLGGSEMCCGSTEGRSAGQLGVFLGAEITSPHPSFHEAAKGAGRRYVDARSPFVIPWLGLNRQDSVPSVLSRGPRNADS